MKKKLFSAFLLVLMLLSVMMLASCDDDVLSSGQPSSDHQHSFTSYVGNNDATCTTDGTKTAKCNGCAATDTVADPGSAGHKLGTWLGEIPATCSAAGVKGHYVCSVCQKNFDSNSAELADLAIPMLAHTYTAWNTEIPATCIETGTAGHYGCTGCDKHFDASYKELAELTLPLAHTVVTDAAVAPTCSAVGRTEGSHCSSCYAVITAQIEIPATGHTAVADAGVAATCTTAGMSDGSHCSACDEILTAQTEIPALGHQESEIIVLRPTCTADGEKTVTCSRCKESRTERLEKLGHLSGGAATCEQDELCTREGCGMTITPRPGHEYTSAVTAPTCEEKGYTTYTCTRCSDSYRADYVTETGHALADADFLAKTPTVVKGSDCKVTKTYTAKCPTCGEDVSKSFETREHTYTAVITTAATCSAEGVKTYTCSGCGDSYTRNYADDEAHDWVTSGESGVIQKQCSLCSEQRTSFVSEGTSGTVSADDLQTAGDVTLDEATLVMDDDVKNQLKGGGETAITVAPLGEGEKASALQNSGLTPEQIANLGTVYDFSITNNSGPVSLFDGYITVRLPYTLAPGDDVDNIVVYYIDENGKLEHFNATYSDGYITFVTNHFSQYVPGKLTPEEACALFDHIEAVHEKSATCTESGYRVVVCQRCGVEVEKQIFDRLPHTYTPGRQVAASCTTHGSCVYTCTCGDSYTEILPATGHKYTVAEEVAATCQSFGYKIHQCTRCDSSYTEGIPQLEHKYTEKKVDATCTAYGSVVRTCSDCGVVHTTVLPATGHNYTEKNHKDATCTTQGYTIYECTNCKNMYKGDLIPARGHNYIETKVAATCTAQGYTNYECAGCKHTYRENFTPALGHDYIDAVVPPTCENEGYTGRTCSRCKHGAAADAVPALGHDYRATKTAATCTAGGYTTYVCNRCSHSYIGDRTEAVGHKYARTVIEPTCEAGGYTLAECSVCHDSKVENATKALGHLDIVEITPPTCTEEGFTEHTCDRCGQYTVDGETAALGHQWSAATCTAPKTCSRCKLTDGKAAGHKIDADSGICFGCGEKLADPVCRHTEKTEKRQEATCTETGKVTAYCKACGLELSGYLLPATGHKYDQTGRCTVCGAADPAVTEKPAPTEPTPTECVHAKTTVDKIDATCTEDGYIHIFCEKCTQTLSYEEIPAYGHVSYDGVVGVCGVCGEKFGDEAPPETECKHANAYEERVEPTCTEDGSSEIFCKDCDQVVFHQNIPATGHVSYDGSNICGVCGESFGEETPPDTECKHENTFEIRHDPTCTADGMVEYYCSACGDFVDKEILSAPGHEWSEDGSYCHTCGERNTDVTEPGESEPPVEGCDHKNVDRQVIEPTCTENGCEIITCYDCGQAFVEILPATGHVSYDGSNVCGVCGETFGEEVPPETGCKHENAYRNQVDATCTADGYIDIKCYDCGQAFVEILPATGHIIDEATGTCVNCGAGSGDITPPDETECKHTNTYEEVQEATCTEDGVILICCADCRVTLEKTEIFATGHQFTDTGICGICGEKNNENIEPGESEPPVEGCAHKNADRQVVEPTCTENGYEIITCYDCGLAFRNVLSATGHVWNEEGYCDLCGATDNGEDTGWESEVPTEPDMTEPNDSEPSEGGCTHEETFEQRHYATCTENGRVEYYCLNCGDYLYDEGIPATGHVWTEEGYCDFCGTLYCAHEETYEYRYTYCESEGVSYIYCSVCSELLSKTVLEATGHQWSEDGSCTECGEIYCAHENTYEYRYDAGCTEDGRVEYYCTDCGDYLYDEGIPATGHQWTEEGYCYICKASSGSADNGWGDLTPDVTEPDDSEGECTHENTYENRCNASCTEDGWVEYYCLNCGDYLYDEGIPATGHQNTREERYEAECVEDGWIDIYCDDCGDCLEEVVIPALGHQYGEDGTCVACGKPYCAHTNTFEERYEYCESEGRCAVYCSDCYELISRTVLEATGHEWGEDGICTKCDKVYCAHENTYERRDEPTCYDNGWIEVLCMDCKESLSSEKIPELEHRIDADGYCVLCYNWFEWDGMDCNHSDTVTETYLPSCTEYGVRVQVCVTCGVVTGTEELESTGHQNTYEERYEPTCTDQGDVWIYCYDCGEVVRVENIEPTGHQNTYEERKESTCTEEGRIRTYCSDCDDLISEEMLPVIEHRADATDTCVLCKIHVNREQTDCKHSFTVTETYPVSCTADGYILQVCSDCNLVLQVEVIAATGHQNTEEITQDPTCVSQGYRIVYCNDCDTYIGLERLEATGIHIFGDDGTCTVCGKVYCPHEHTHEESVEVTCTRDGWSGSVCEDCGDILNKVVVKAVGHQFDEVGICTVCGGESITLNGYYEATQDGIRLGFGFDEDHGVYRYHNGNLVATGSYVICNGEMYGYSQTEGWLDDLKGIEIGEDYIILHDLELDDSVTFYLQGSASDDTAAPDADGNNGTDEGTDSDADGNIGADEGVAPDANGNGAANGSGNAAADGSADGRING